MSDNKDLDIDLDFAQLQNRLNETAKPPEKPQKKPKTELIPKKPRKVSESPKPQKSIHDLLSKYEEEVEDVPKQQFAPPPPPLKPTSDKKTKFSMPAQPVEKEATSPQAPVESLASSEQESKPSTGQTEGLSNVSGIEFPVPKHTFKKLFFIDEGIKADVLRCNERRKTAVVRVKGFIDHTNAPKLKVLMDRLRDKELIEVVLDLSSSTYVGSAGWGVIAERAKFLQAMDGDLSLFGMNEDMLNGFQMLQFDQIVHWSDNLEESIDFFDHQPEQSHTESHGVEVLPQQATQPISPPAEILEKADPLRGKISEVIAAFGPQSVGQLRKKLERPEYGSFKIGGFKLRQILKDMNLENKEKQLRFYRSV